MKLHSKDAVVFVGDEIGGWREWDSWHGKMDRILLLVIVCLH